MPRRNSARTWNALYKRPKRGEVAFKKAYDKYSKVVINPPKSLPPERLHAELMRVARELGKATVAMDPHRPGGGAEYVARHAAAVMSMARYAFHTAQVMAPRERKFTIEFADFESVFLDEFDGGDE